MKILIEDLEILKNKTKHNIKFGSLYKDYNGFIEYQIFLDGHDCIITYGTVSNGDKEFIETENYIGINKDSYLEYDKNLKKVVSKNYY